MKLILGTWIQIKRSHNDVFKLASLHLVWLYKYKAFLILTRCDPKDWYKRNIKLFMKPLHVIWEPKVFKQEVTPFLSFRLSGLMQRILRWRQEICVLVPSAPCLSWVLGKSAKPLWAADLFSWNEKNILPTFLDIFWESNENK